MAAPARAHGGCLRPRGRASRPRASPVGLLKLRARRPPWWADAVCSRDSRDARIRRFATWQQGKRNARRASPISCTGLPGGARSCRWWPRFSEEEVRRTLRFRQARLELACSSGVPFERLQAEGLTPERRGVLTRGETSLEDTVVGPELPPSVRHHQDVPAEGPVPRHVRNLLLQADAADFDAVT